MSQRSKFKGSESLTRARDLNFNDVWKDIPDESSSHALQTTTGAYTCTPELEPTPPNTLEPSKRVQRQLPVKFQEWFRLPTGEPLSPEMRAKLKLELKKYYYSYRDCIYRKETKVRWTSECMFTFKNRYNIAESN